MRSRVLAVDDNQRNLAILKRCLEPEFSLRMVTSGNEGLEVAREWRPDLVLLDIMMPGLDGYETCRLMRADHDLAGMKIVMVSAKGQTQERIEGYAAGADDYIVKPFDHQELIAKVRVYVRLKSIEELDRLKSDLLDLLNHETGTPLTGIMGSLVLMRDTPGLTAEQNELLDVAEASTERLHGLVQRVSLIAQLKARAIPEPHDPVDLRGLIAEALLIVSDQASRGGVHTEVQHSGAPLQVTGDPVLLLWVVEALLNNAIRVSPRGGRVAVVVSEGAAGPCITVADQGPGIYPELAARVFEEFAVADIRHHQRGTGLSLAAARMIARHHEGELTLETEYGRGAAFRLQLPPPRPGSAASEGDGRVAA